MDAENPEWYSGVGTSAAGNLLTLVVFGLLFALKKLCNRPGRCKSKCHTFCLDVQYVDRGLTTYSCNGNSVADVEAPERTVQLTKATD